ncbi:transcriptional regulator [Paenibacillus sp. 1011MAR3C5]|uniref:helix-turn-helix transcriptional regulator n=1 Tax=Paenibacillus sp. 1011MAR3C5 TaxID=1675787 RepID=UPI000E6BBA83|nr:metalloregulator ArsR/SmtB family transcription factor [Paenibacillus sp. 1011MAR3C5]RJE86960.1 transcriptional regulator [Paenibacillus sp. 1011MAR3C5]
MKEDLELSTREIIMKMLKTQSELSAKDITEQLGITGMAVRRHLAVLEKEELIEYTTVRQPMGRPVSVYRLTEKAEDFFPKRYHAVALDLLSELKEEAGEEMVNHLFDLRQVSMQKRYLPNLDGKDLESRIAALAQIQSNNGYMATWEKTSDDVYELTEYNCPIYQVANNYNHACTCELRLFESLLGAEVKRTECLAKQGKKCVYRIRKKSPSDHVQ